MTNPNRAILPKILTTAKSEESQKCIKDGISIPAAISVLHVSTLTFQEQINLFKHSYILV
jgi:hypothetical protein